ncbi:MAG: hypothetical protein KGP28_09125 [Bdellovibrionales bacterium]|nr:hypothetical protein [Bdellovibrionales bacterium]
MLFEAKKLELDSAEDLYQCRVSSVKPFALMLSPVYVFMKRNQKFVSVKAPLDFFTPDELSSLGRYEEFFLPKIISEVSCFQTSARVVRGILKMSRKSFPPSPFEVSNEIIKVTGASWGRDLRVSSFCAAIFADELCGHLESAELLLGRESAVVKHDLGLLLSGMLIFTLVHLGWHDLEVLKKMRAEVYSRTIRGEEWSSPSSQWEMVTSDLLRMMDLRLDLGLRALREFSSQWSFELGGRLKRLQESGRTYNERGEDRFEGGFSW